MIINELSEHQTHDLHRDTGTAVLEHLNISAVRFVSFGQLTHLQQGQRGDVDCLAAKIVS